VITAQTPLSTFGRGALQESSCTGVNTVELFHYCTRYSTLVSHVEQFEHKLITAIMTAFSSPMGPAHISVPSDVMRHPSPNPSPSCSLPKLLNKPALFDHEAVDHLYVELSSTKNPVFLIGDEADEAIGLILTLAIRLHALLIVTPHGKGLVSPFHPLFRGVIGFSGHSSAQRLLIDPNVERLFIIGANLGEWASNGWDSRLFGKRLIHIESTESNLARTPMAALHVRGRLKTIFEQILNRLENESPPMQVDHQGAPTEVEQKRRYFALDDEAGFNSDATPIKPHRLMRDLPDIFPPNTHYLADSGNSFSWAIHYLHPYDRRRSGIRDGRGGLFQVAMEFASMGWAIGSAIGVALARPGNPVVCLVGDGSMLMAGQEITVAIQEKLPVVFIVLNDSAYGMVRHGQQKTGAESIGHQLPQIDFAAFAEAMGVPGYVIQSPSDLQKVNAAQICRRNGPSLLDVRIDREECPPIGLRTRILRDCG